MSPEVPHISEHEPKSPRLIFLSHTELELPLGLKVFDALTLQEKIKIGQAFTDVE